MNAQLNPAVRLIPPSQVTGASWLADNLLERRRYQLSRDAAAALVAASRPQECDQLAQWLAGNDARGQSVHKWMTLIGSLRARSLIVDASFAVSNAEVAWLTGIRRSWSRFGWDEAAEYHVLSFDYPCVDYSEFNTALQADRGRMRRYQSMEPDSDRFKLDYLGAPEIPLPDPREDLSAGTAENVWSGWTEPAHADSNLLARILALAFGQTGRKVPVTDSAPLLLRSSPSGGGRNPSEGYVVVRHLPGIEAAWYHVTMRPLGLRKLERLPVDDTVLRELFPDTLERCLFDVKALIVITSVFERNMYRYREPRTFRTVHMDAGHIAATLQMAGRSLGLVAGVFYCDDARRIESHLGIDGMREGYMVTVAIADGGADVAPSSLSTVGQTTAARS